MVKVLPKCNVIAKIICVKCNDVRTTINPSDCIVFVEKLRSAKQSLYLINISVASNPAMYKLGLLGNTERNLRKISRLTNQTRKYQVC